MKWIPCHCRWTRCHWHVPHLLGAVLILKSSEAYTTISWLLWRTPQKAPMEETNKEKDKNNMRSGHAAKDPVWKIAKIIIIKISRLITTPSLGWVGGWWWWCVCVGGGGVWGCRGGRKREKKIGFLYFSRSLPPPPDPRCVSFTSNEKIEGCEQSTALHYHSITRPFFYSINHLQVIIY